MTETRTEERLMHVTHILGHLERLLQTYTEEDPAWPILVEFYDYLGSLHAALKLQ